MNYVGDFMERMNIPEDVAFQYVLNALRDLGYLGSLKIEKFICDEHYDYIVTETLHYKGEETKRLIPMTGFSFNRFIEYGLALKGAEDPKVKSYLDKGRVIYFTEYEAVSYGKNSGKYGYKKKRR